MRNAAFFLDDELGRAGDRGTGRRRQGHRLVEGIGVQGLGAAEHRGQGFDRGAHDVVIGVLLGQRDPGSLAMGAQRQRLRVLRIELPHQLGPEEARGTQLRHFHEEVHPIAKKKDSRGANASTLSPFDKAARTYSNPSAKVKASSCTAVAPGLLHVIAGDRDRIELRHVRRRVGDDVGDDAHRRRGRIDVGVPHHELFEDVVLDRAGELGQRHALFLAGDDEGGQHRQHRAVHGHRDRHLVERDPRRTGSSCPRRNRSRPQPCRHRPRRAGGRCHSRDGWQDRRRPRDPSARASDSRDRRRWSLRPWRSRHIAGWSRAVGVHGRAGPAGIGREAGQAPERLQPFKIGRGVERFTVSPSGVSQSRLDAAPPFSSASASFSQSAQVGPIGLRFGSSTIRGAYLPFSALQNNER